MRTTFVSCLVLLTFSSVNSAQSVVYSTDSNGVVYSSTAYDTITTTSSYSTTSTDSALTAGYASTTISTSYTAGSTYGTPTTAYSPQSTNIPAIQTVPFTGQALLVGTCAIARFTTLTLPDGSSLAVPLVGCSDDRPECCPSLNFNSTGPEETGSASGSAVESTGESETSTSSWTGTTPSPTPTGVMSMLSQAPLTVCPSDMVDIDPVCCPSGFQVYGQVLVGNYPPCVSTLTKTTTAGPEVFASISSAAASSAATATTTASSVPTVDVIVNSVFALGLPCADKEEEGTHLSTGAKAGIGAGAGVLALLIIGFFWGCLAVRHRRRRKMKTLQAANTDAGGNIRPEAGAYAIALADSKHLSSATTATGSPMMQQKQLYDTQAPHGFGPAFGYAPPGQMHHAYGQPYGFQPVGTGYPGGMNSYPQSQSPPPPFYNPGAGSYDQGFGYYKPPAEVAGNEIHHNHNCPPGMNEHGMSDTQSQVTSTTAVTGSQYQGERPMPPPVELSSQASTRH